MENYTNSTISALVSASAFYEFHLDLDDLAAHEGGLLSDELTLIKEVIANENLKMEDIENLLKICEDSMSLLTPELRHKMESAVQRVRERMAFRPVLRIDENSNGKASNAIK